jgi:hypothetical protein
VTPSGAEQLQFGTDTWTRISDALEQLVKP